MALNQAFTPLNNQRGQAVTEYILMLAFAVVAFMMLMSWVSSSKLAQKLAKPIQQDFAKAYKYGNPKASGYDDDGGPQNHPRINDSSEGNNFRIFLNPRII